MIAGLLLAAAAAASMQASQGTGLWFTCWEAGTPPVMRLCLQGPEADGRQYVSLRALSGEPRAIAAHGDSVWVLPEQGEGAAVSLLALRARWDAQMESWRTSPPQGLDRLPPLEADGAVELLVGGPAGPVLLSRRQGGNVLAVHALRRGAWHTLPEVRTEDTPIAGVATADDVTLLTRSDEGEAALWRFVVGPDEWSRTALAGIEGTPHDLVRSGRSLLLGLQHDDGTRMLAWVQDGAVVPWASFDDVGDDATLLASESGLHMFRMDGETPMVRVLDRASGEAGVWEPLRLRSNLGGRLWSLAVSISIALVVVLMLVFGRSSKVVSLPEGCQVAPLPRRVVAFFIDFVPGVVAIPIVLGASPLDLASAVLTGPIPATIPVLLVAAATTVAWGIIWEVPTNRTPGKRIMGLRVARLRGDGIVWWRTAARNLLKGVTILVPPLAIIVVLGPLGQGPGDAATGTLVVQCGGGPKKV